MNDINTRLELWNAVEGYEGVYEVSTLGRIKRVGGGLLNPWPNKDGYLWVRLTCKSAKKRQLVKAHRVVAQAFLPNPHGKPYVNHIDNNPSNNCVENLEWCTQSENLAHARHQGRMPNNYWVGRRSPNSRLTDEQVRSIREDRINTLYSLNQLAAKYGTSKRTIGRIVNNQYYPLPTPPAADGGHGA